jgi:hypothetical protein
MLTIIKDWHQTLSWKLGFGRGKEGRAYSCPWWVDKTVYALAYMQGKEAATEAATRSFQLRAIWFTLKPQPSKRRRTSDMV